MDPTTTSVAKKISFVEIPRRISTVNPSGICQKTFKIHLFCDDYKVSQFVIAHHHEEKQLGAWTLKSLLFIYPILIGIGVASYYLYLDYHPQNTEIEEEANREMVGEIVFADNSVKRQFGDDVLWNDVTQKTPVYSKDSIRTGEDSMVGIKLADSTIIEVAENSLIVLDKDMQNLSINFKAGDLSTKNSGKELEIKINDSVVKGAAGADMKLRTGPGSETSIEVAKGKATVTGKDKKTVEISQAERAGLTQTGQTNISRIAVILRTPEHKSKIQSNATTLSQAFTWEVTRPDLNLEQLEVAPNNRFTPDATKIYRGHQALTVPLAQGTYFWRVGWLDKSRQTYTEIRQLTIGRDNRLELVYPDNGSGFDLEPQENSVDLQWHSVIPVKAFVAEVSTTSDFRNIAHTKTLAETKLTVKDLPPRTYFWRVRAFGEKNEELAVSAAYTFSLKVKLPKTPELIKPQNETLWETAEPVEMTWKKNDKAAEYRLTISHDPEQRDIVKTLTMANQSYSWKWPNAGIYYWGVKALGPKAIPIGQSEVRKVTIRTKQLGPAFLLLNPKERGIVTRDLTAPEPEPILFQWQTLRPLPGPVTLLISNNQDFKEPVKVENLDQVSHSLSLKKAGTYYWKLISAPPTADGTESKKPETSGTATFILKGSNSGMAPQALEPAHKESVEVTEPSPVKFVWSPVAGSAQYHIVVQRIEPRTNEKVPVMDRLVKETTITSGNLPEGLYVWTLSAMDVQGQEGVTSRPYEFTLVVPEQMAPPKLNAPVIK